jgi:hypothetical protein
VGEEEELALCVKQFKSTKRSTRRWLGLGSAAPSAASHGRRAAAASTGGATISPIRSGQEGRGKRREFTWRESERAGAGWRTSVDSVLIAPAAFILQAR